MKIKININTNKPQVGLYVKCHTLLHMRNYPTDIRAIPGRKYRIIDVQQRAYPAGFRILDERGHSHGFDTNTYRKWFNAEFEEKGEVN